jgi:nitrogen-specific signal transduction histidine kinase
LIKKFSEIIFSSRFISKWRVKAALAISAIVIVLSVIIYTQYLVNELINREQRAIQFYAKMYHYYSDPKTNFDDFEFFLNDFIPTISFPIIITDKDNEPYSFIDPVTNDTTFDEYTLNIDLTGIDGVENQRKYLRNLVREMSELYPPIVVKLQEEDFILMKLYYKHSTLVDNLRLFPLIAIVIMASFIIIGYMAFSSIRKSEESRVWVGMAKEAAHQLGTPLSSLFAWLEILKLNKNIPESIESTTSEMQKDLDRLNKITTRFSKIGSAPENKVCDIARFIDNVCLYFERRLPHLGKKIEIIKNLEINKYFASINDELFEWVIENLLKNAAEAIEDRTGTVIISVYRNIRKKIVISVKDTGKGMTSRIKRQVFYPGFTTKKRGWGLGLSLTKRIIEDYHHGKIYIKDTYPGKGTTFIVELPADDPKINN